mmetsp:Transcript_65007/g.128533  ORF Transcript_65007/g.128533 Transcript_65007/m.128533 type:complete len:388 (-) Transcript_65007:82-1245(-)
MVDDVDFASIRQSINRAKEDTAAFGRDVDSLPAIRVPRAPPGKAREVFEHFDLNRSGVIDHEEVLLGLRAFGLDVDNENVQQLLTELDTDGTGCISLHSFSGLIERVAVLRQSRVWPTDTERLAVAARALHAQAQADPLALVAEGEVPTLLRCAASGHAAVEQLGLSALAFVAEAPQAQCAQAIASRPALLDLISSLGTRAATLRVGCVRQGARLLGALCQEAAEAREVGARRSVRLRLYEVSSPLLHGPFGERCANDEYHAAASIALVLRAFAMEAELMPRLGADGGGGGLRLTCTLARSPSAGARAAAVVAIAALAANSDNAWSLIGFGAIEPLLAAAADPTLCGLHGEVVAPEARRALDMLGFDSFWKGVRGADPLLRHVALGL